MIGLDPGCDIVIADARVSRRHAVLSVEDGRWVLADSGSANGIYAGNCAGPGVSGESANTHIGR